MHRLSSDDVPGVEVRPEFREQAVDDPEAIEDLDAAERRLQLEPRRHELAVGDVVPGHHADDGRSPRPQCLQHGGPPASRWSGTAGAIARALLISLRALLEGDRDEALAALDRAAAE